MSRIDYAGISVLIAGSNMPPIYYAFYCPEYKTLRILYLTFILFFCSIAFFISLWPSFTKSKYRPFRGILYIIIGLLSIVP
mmetsp:Transcript_27474/g.26554  ORF Transcript_27474/g.26554 Transcript_27474/m.26554 type:complete len:81 (-) Transcript_27474:287-529(-)